MDNPLKITMEDEASAVILKNNDTQKEELTLQRVRKQYVAQRVDLVQKSKGKLTRVQGIAIRYMISKVQPTDGPHKKYTFSFREFSLLMRYKTDSYTDIKNMLQSIRDISWWRDADDPEDDDILMGWFHIVHVNERKGTATISFHEDVFPYLLDLKKQYENEGHHYFQYLLENISLMKGLYSADLYELLRRYANNKQWTFEIGTGTGRDIQLRLAKTEISTGRPIVPEGWKNWAIFERDVLKPSKREINTYSDILIDYEPSKIDFSGHKYRRYISITFYIALKTKVEQEQTESLINAEYSQIEDSERYKQLTIQDIFALNRSKAQEEDRIAKELKESEIREKEVENYKYPVFKACLPGFTDKELDYLFGTAIEHLEPQRIPYKDRELWATDYVTHYFKAVQATEKDTKTTVYKRLLDMVKKDYDHFAVQIIGYDEEKHWEKQTIRQQVTQEPQSAEEIKQKILELQRQLNEIEGDN